MWGGDRGRCYVRRRANVDRGSESLTVGGAWADRLIGAVADRVVEICGAAAAAAVAMAPIGAVRSNVGAMLAAAALLVLSCATLARTFARACARWRARQFRTWCRWRFKKDLLERGTPYRRVDG